MAWCLFGTKPLPEPVLTNFYFISHDSFQSIDKVQLFWLKKVHLKMPSVDASVCQLGLMIFSNHISLYDRDSYKSHNGTTVNASRRKINVQGFMFCMEHVFDKNTEDSYFDDLSCVPFKQPHQLPLSMHTHHNLWMICMDFRSVAHNILIQMLHVNRTGQKDHDTS